MKQPQPLQKRRVALRRCVACRTQRPKRELMRVVRTPYGVVVDPSGRANGRGAYLCLRILCWEQGLKKGRLDHALRERISPENRRTLGEFAQTLDQIKQEPATT